MSRLAGFAIGIAGIVLMTFPFSIYFGFYEFLPTIYTTLFVPAALAILFRRIPVFRKGLIRNSPGGSAKYPGPILIWFWELVPIPDLLIGSFAGIVAMRVFIWIVVNAEP